MKTLTAILVIASFLQATILPINLVLIILICRAYIKADKANLILAFAAGLLVSHLSLSPLGFQSVIFLILIQITLVLSKSQVASHPLFIIPLTFILLTLNDLALFRVINFIFLPSRVLESLLSLPIFYLIRLWEERFIVKKDIKLRL